MSALEQSVTLEDVFAVVSAKRVPLAPELAGYLTLEIAEGAQPTEGDVDPRTVFIGEEGSVALVRPRKENASGDAETSVRAILGRLLEASGSQTPALGATARRKPSGGLPPLVAELEAALIPVNRAAGRRALARLAREVKRVTLGVGRNAAVPERPVPTRPSVPSQAAMRAELPPVSAPPRPAPQAASVPVPVPVSVPAAVLESGAPLAVTPEFPVVAPVAPRPLEMPRTVSLLPTGVEAPPVASASPPRVATAPPPPVAETPRVATASPPPVAVKPVAILEAAPDDEAANAVPEPLPSEPSFPDLDLLPRGLTSRPPEKAAPPAVEADVLATHLPGPDEVDDLLAQFEVSGNTTDRAVSRELKAMVGLDPTPPPPSAPSPADEGVEQLLALSDQSIAIANVTAPRSPVAPPPAPPSTPARTAPSSVSQQPKNAAVPAPIRAQAPPPPAPKSAPKLAPAPAPLAAAAQSSREAARMPTVHLVREPRQPRAPKLDRILIVLTLLVLIGGAALTWTLKPGFFTGRTAERVEQERKAAAAAKIAQQAQAAAHQVARCRAALVVSDVPPRAEVLLRHGQAPVDIEKMPVGARLELVATAEGFAPKRAVVPSGAAWDGVEGKQRFEIAVQLDPTKLDPAKAKTTADPWPASEPGSHVGGSGPPGTVHVVSTPRGAEVWLLVGAAPEATIDPIKCDADVDVLIAGPTTFRKRLHVTAADVNAASLGESGTAAGAHVVRLSAGAK